MFYFLGKFEREISTWSSKIDLVAHALKFTAAFSAPRVNTVNIKEGDPYDAIAHIQNNFPLHFVGEQNPPLPVL